MPWLHCPHPPPPAARLAGKHSAACISQRFAAQTPRGDRQAGTYPFSIVSGRSWWPRRPRVTLGSQAGSALGTWEQTPTTVPNAHLSFCDSESGRPEPAEEPWKSVRGAGVGRQGPGQVHRHGAKGHCSRAEPHPVSFSVASRGAPQPHRVPQERAVALDSECPEGGRRVPSHPWRLWALHTVGAQYGLIHRTDGPDLAGAFFWSPCRSWRTRTTQLW